MISPLPTQGWSSESPPILPSAQTLVGPVCLRPPQQQLELAPDNSDGGGGGGSSAVLPIACEEMEWGVTGVAISAFTIRAGDSLKVVYSFFSCTKWRCVCTVNLISMAVYCYKVETVEMSTSFFHDLHTHEENFIADQVQ